MKVYGGVEV